LNINDYIYVATESGRILSLDLKDGTCTQIFQDPACRTAMGLLVNDSMLYFGGHALIGSVRITETGYKDIVTRNMYRPIIDGVRYRFLNRLGYEEWSLHYGDPALHQMTMVNDEICISATGCNEVWRFSRDLRLLQRIPIHPRKYDFNHLNNVFWDGSYYYVCLMRLKERFGYGGYAKFTSTWEEVERKALGWEAHAFSVINGDYYNLCASAGSKQKITHPHKAGLMVNGTFVFEHDPDKYYCKDFSMDEEKIYIVGGEVTSRTERKKANGVIFVLDRNFSLCDTLFFNGLGGFSGCRLPVCDYTNSAVS